MAVFFLLLVVIVQAAFLLVARETASAAAAAAARAAARPGASVDAERVELLANVARTVPGAIDPQATVSIEDGDAVARVRFGWSAPGPDLLPITVHLSARAPTMAAP